MSGFSDAMNVAASGMQAQAQRMRFVAENIANSDTPGYRRKLVSFEAEVVAGQRNGSVAVGPLTLDRTALEQVYDPTHPLAGPEGFYNGSNVNLLIEIADSREASRSYEANLKMFDQVRQMSSSLNELLRNR